MGRKGKLALEQTITPLSHLPSIRRVVIPPALPDLPALPALPALSAAEGSAAEGSAAERSAPERAIPQFLILNS
jgi:hypothetical protein